MLFSAARVEYRDLASEHKLCTRILVIVIGITVCSRLKVSRENRTSAPCSGTKCEHGLSILNFLMRCFRFTEKSCPLYAPPKNGALLCNIYGTDRSCSVKCQTGYDFVFNPPYLYFCSVGVWNFYSITRQNFSRTLPWPDCSRK